MPGILVLFVEPKRKPFIKMIGMQTLFHRSGFLAFGGGAEPSMSGLPRCFCFTNKASEHSGNHPNPPLHPLLKPNWARGPSYHFIHILVFLWGRWSPWSHCLFWSTFAPSRDQNYIFMGLESGNMLANGKTSNIKLISAMMFFNIETGFYLTESTDWNVSGSWAQGCKQGFRMTYP